MPISNVAGHRIHEAEIEAGNMGARYSAWRAFCACGWCSERTADRERYDRLVREHLDQPSKETR